MTAPVDVALIVLDTETRSRCDIQAEGGARYVRHPTTELLGACAVALDRQLVPRAAWIWTPHLVGMPRIKLVPPRAWPELSALPIEVVEGQLQPPVDLAGLLAAGIPVAAHNAEGFDRPLLAHLGIVAPGQWVDTLALSRRRGLPGRLDAQGKYLYDQGKSGIGKRVLKLLVEPHERTGEFVVPNDGTLGAAMQRCADDVALTCCVLVDELAVQTDPAWEARVREVDAIINARGFGFDSELALALVEADRWVRAREHARVLELTNGEVTPAVLGSPQQLARWLATRGYGAGELAADACLAIVRHPQCDPIVRAVLWARVGHSRIAAGKFGAGLAQVEGGRLRGSLAYYAALTGRWGGRGFQPQNLQRPLESIDAATTADAVIAEVRAGREGARAIVRAARKAGVTPDDVIGTLARSTIVPKPGRWLAVADYSAIEGRGVCWVADDQDGLAVYREGRDPYVDFAAQLYELPYDELRAAVKAGDKAAKLKRQAGKVGVLGCIAEGTDVLVRVQGVGGWAPIETVPPGVEVWDGDEWVVTAGAVYQGEREVICRWGVELTPDHQLLTTRGWVAAERVPGCRALVARVPNQYVHTPRPAPEGPRWGVTRRVWDLLDCGPRQRFAIRGSGPEALAVGVIAHNCGYNMGYSRLAAFAVGLGVDLAKAGKTPRDVVEAWRDSHPRIAGRHTGRVHEASGVVLRTGGLWRALGDAAMAVVSGRASEVEVGRVLYAMSGRHLVCVLPSGRELVYRNARVMPISPSWGGNPRPAIVYDKARSSSVSMASTYGGKLCENIVQAVCRDLLAPALVRLEDAGVEVVLHVHDEIVAEVDDERGLHLVAEAMCEPPEWADGFPIGVDGHLCRRYGKDAGEDAVKVEIRRELLRS